MDFSLEKLKSNNVFVAIIFALTIFIQCLLFHYSCFGYVAFSSLWHAPAVFFAFYASKLLPAIFLASFIFLTKRYWWSIIISILIALWMIANIIYYRANELFINVDAISMVDNMNGFWSSIWLYVNWECFAILILSCFYIIIVIFNKSGEKSWRNCVFSLCCAVLLYLTNLFFGFDYDLKHYSRPDDWPKYKGLFVAPRYAAAGYYSIWESIYIEGSSVLQYAVAETVFFANKVFDGERIIQFSDADNALIETLTNNEKSITPTSNLILIIVESLESWPIGLNDVNGNPVAPNLDKLIKGRCLYCSNIKSQVLQGTSGDGQMIINTGLLPIQPGAACVKYGSNKYPCFARLYKNGGVLCPNYAWNQPVVSKSYGYKFSKKPSPSTEKDVVVFDMLKSYVDTASLPYCVQLITISMHAPFNRVDCGMSFDKNIPSDLDGYLNCLHYTDSCIGDFFLMFEHDSLYSNTTIAITGDHTIFKYSKLQDFQSYAKQYNYPIPDKESYCPLIVYSPTINSRVEINELCYQMDIFPTILHCIGADDYFWKGFGVNLLDSVARNKRSLTEDEAYMLSDKMIRSDYFRQYEKKQ